MTVYGVVAAAVIGLAAFFSFQSATAGSDIRANMTLIAPAGAGGAAEVEAEVRRHFGALVFTTTVPRSVRLAEAPSHGLPAIAYDRRSPGAEAYWKVAMELVERN